MKLKSLFLAAVSLITAVLVGGRLTAFDKAGVARNVSVMNDSGQTNDM